MLWWITHHSLSSLSIHHNIFPTYNIANPTHTTQHTHNTNTTHTTHTTHKNNKTNKTQLTLALVLLTLELLTLLPLPRPNPQYAIPTAHIPLFRPILCVQTCLLQNIHVHGGQHRKRTAFHFYTMFPYRTYADPVCSDLLASEYSRARRPT